MCVFQYILVNYAIWIVLNNGFNKLKVDDSIHVTIVQKLWKFSLNYSNIISECWITHVLIYSNKCKMQFVNNGFNILKSEWFNSNNWRDVKKIINSFQYECGVLNSFMCFDKLW